MRPAVSHLYVHVPFCPTICPFCDFHVLERRAGSVSRYLDGLAAEASRVTRDHDLRALDTVYLGGGTPSYLRADELARLVGIVRDELGWAHLEATLEVHPSTVTPERAREWVELGFTRLSVGVQSFDDAVLATLGRPHDAAAGLAAVEACVASGAITSLDLITAVPGQDVEDDLRRAADLGVDHVSAYVLTIEPDTPFGRDHVEVSGDAELAALGAAESILTGAGLLRYEVSNHARPGAESVHNQAYWRNRWFVGLGPSASSHLPVADGVDPGDDTAVSWRRRNPGFEPWLAGEPGETEPRDADELLGDAMLCGLRLVRGVDLAEVAQQCGIDPLVRYATVVESLVEAGRIEVDGGFLRATPAGFVVLDQVAAAFV